MMLQWADTGGRMTAARGMPARPEGRRGQTLMRAALLGVTLWAWPAGAQDLAPAVDGTRAQTTQDPNAGVGAAGDAAPPDVSAQRAAPADIAGPPVSAPAASGDRAAPTGAGGGLAPLIAAPDDPARLPPSALIPLGETGGYNALAASDPIPATPGSDRLGMPVVVELFTSQGCSSCPPADAMLGALAGQPDVLPLSWHVDYWDYLGWADSFARPEFSARQEAYARAAGERSVYTPQLIVGGVDTALAPGPAQLMGLIDLHRLAPAMVSLQRHGTGDSEQIELLALSDLGGRAAVELVRYAPVRRVEMLAGENRGRIVEYRNIVLDIQRLAEWDGRRPLRLTVRQGEAASARMAGPGASAAFPADTRHAIIVQMVKDGHAPLPGQIIAAMRLED